LRDVSLRDRYVQERERFLIANVPQYLEQRVFASTLLITQFAEESILLELEATAVL
jgi:hypothetical protein